MAPTKKIANLLVISFCLALFMNVSLQGDQLQNGNITYQITSLDFGEGYSASGRITTDGTIGPLDTSNLVSWNISVIDANIGEDDHVFTKSNSHWYAKKFSTDNVNLNVDFPDGVLQVQSNQTQPTDDQDCGTHITCHSLSLARFDFNRNYAYYSNNIDGFSAKIEDIGSSPSYIAATIPEPATLSLFILGALLFLPRHRRFSFNT